MHIQGTAFAPRSSVRYEAHLDISQVDGLSLYVDGEMIRCQQQDVDISVPVGNLPVRFTFPDGWVFVVDRSAEVSAWLKLHRKSGLLDRMESNMMAWLVAVVVCVGVVLGAYVYILPWGSEKVAQSLPDSVSVSLGNKILQTMDKQWQASELPPERQDAIRQRITRHVQKLPNLPFPVDIVFRSSGMGANAFALPGGKVILLDQLVELTANEQQLDSIILHEIGHVYHRHMMERLVHSSVLSVGVAFLTGESSGIVDNLAGIGVFFLSNGQSRQAENEADDFAKQAMLEIYGTSEPMAEMFELFRQQSSKDVPEWFNTHPGLEHRIQAARDE